MAMNQMSGKPLYLNQCSETDPVCAPERGEPMMAEANSLAAELEKRILGLAGSLDGFADGLLGGELKVGEAGGRENSLPPGELYRLTSRMRAAHAAVTVAEAAFARLRPVL